MRFFIGLAAAAALVTTIAGCTSPDTHMTPYVERAARHRLDNGGSVPGKSAPVPAPSPTP
ncbi:MAG TPA: hypothetical protein VFE17_03010 [Candidatus Baltobacteraceae bacterium]|jgi:hypothetical protein|nr:hypothetical protein [Candidatus Baltobacteraceae bacterium]